MAQAMIGQRRQGGGRLLTTRMDTSEMEYRERDVVGGSPHGCRPTPLDLSVRGKNLCFPDPDRCAVSQRPEPSEEGGS